MIFFLLLKCLNLTLYYVKFSFIAVKWFLKLLHVIKDAILTICHVIVLPRERNSISFKNYSRVSYF